MKTRRSLPAPNAAVMDYRTGRCLGLVCLTRRRWDQYRKRAQWPQGILEAGVILSERELDALALDARRVVWLE